MSTSTDAKRVFVAVTNLHPLHVASWDSPDKVFQHALKLLQNTGLVATENPDYQFIAKERYNKIFFIYDIGNVNFRLATAHLPGDNDLPVLCVTLGKEEHVQAASRPVENQVNLRLREIYECHGYDAHPPFSIDHANGNIPTYTSPRTLSHSVIPSQSH
ncbi:hypothetical protein J3459_017455 [Metarhizium acridum]|uniref:uncharacterized protein n=1 Tax=Metarhizium acridum TaxID=92637 RepID=UPI001C6C9192|nr:hypothetical protein J3458_021411 [Metarhizium acridum]KAG8409496.1 hypothetical protein J3459_017455 [Metarhizium acridum]